MAKLRHIALSVPDPWATAQFYMQAFGMKKVGEVLAGPLGKDFVGLHHIGFWVDNVKGRARGGEGSGSALRRRAVRGQHLLRGEVPRSRERPHLRHRSSRAKT